ncbi:MAG: ASCH domain-containing protein [Planctomycetota bacterium]
MSVALTIPQVLNESKDVTRRIGWWFLNVGDRIQLCEKCMGLKPGRSLVKLKVVEVVNTWPERLDSISEHDVSREGFPNMTSAEFVAMFCKSMKVDPWKLVNRIEFKYLKGAS